MGVGAASDSPPTRASAAPHTGTHRSLVCVRVRVQRLGCLRRQAPPDRPTLLGLLAHRIGRERLAVEGREGAQAVRDSQTAEAAKAVRGPALTRARAISASSDSQQGGAGSGDGAGWEGWGRSEDERKGGREDYLRCVNYIVRNG